MVVVTNGESAAPFECGEPNSDRSSSSRTLPLWHASCHAFSAVVKQDVPATVRPELCSLRTLAPMPIVLTEFCPSARLASCASLSTRCWAIVVVRRHWSSVPVCSTRSLGCTTNPRSNAPFHHHQCPSSTVDGSLDSVLRNFVLPSAHGCRVSTRHLTACTTESPMCVRLTRSGILICPPSVRPTRSSTALACLVKLHSSP